MPLALGIKAISFLVKVVHGMDEHQDHKKLACRKMKLSEKPAIGDKGGDFFNVLKNISHGAIVK